MKTIKTTVESKSLICTIEDSSGENKKYLIEEQDLEIVRDAIEDHLERLSQEEMIAGNNGRMVARILGRQSSAGFTL